MNKIAFIISAFWGNRKETIEQSSYEMAKLLMSLARHNQDLQKVSFLTSEGCDDIVFNTANYNVADLAKEICKEFIKHKGDEILKSNTDIKVLNGDFAEKIGFRYYFYCIKPENYKFEIVGDLGGFDWVKCKVNFIRMCIPEEPKIELDWVRPFFNDLIEQFQPASAGIYPEFTSRLKGNPKEYPGWINYYSNEFDTPDLSVFEQVNNYKELGKICKLTQEEFNIQNPQHIEKWKEAYKKYLEKYPIN